MIVTDESILRLKCEDVLPEEVDSLISKLEDELKSSGDRGRPGIGLAAPQIAIHKKIAIVRDVFDDNGSKLQVNLVNAEIKKAYKKTIFLGEGCLSFPDKKVKTMRYQEIVVKNDISPFLFIATGLFAVAIQHELDHLQGILLPDVDVDGKK